MKVLNSGLGRATTGDEPIGTLVAGRLGKSDFVGLVVDDDGDRCIAVLQGGGEAFPFLTLYGGAQDVRIIDGEVWVEPDEGYLPFQMPVEREAGTILISEGDSLGIVVATGRGGSTLRAFDFETGKRSGPQTVAMALGGWRLMWRHPVLKKVHWLAKAPHPMA